jgi:hypothetical protein
MEPLLTIPEIAEVLRIDPADTLALLENGSLPGVKIAGEWRMLPALLVEHVNRETAAAQQRLALQTLRTHLCDPRTWTDQIRRDPEKLAAWRKRDFEHGTFGAWIKAALRAEDEERDTLAALEAAWNADHHAGPEDEDDRRVGGTP